MEEQQFDPQAMLSRAGELVRYVRKSEAYPVIVGGIAGGIAGAVMAVLIAGRVASSSRGEVSSHREGAEETADAAKEAKGWSLREVVQLATIAATLLRQAQEWYQERQRTNAG